MHFRASSFSWPAVSSGGRRRRALDFGSCWLLLLFLPVALFAAVMPRSLVVVMIVVVVVVVLHLHLHLHFALCDIPLPLYINIGVVSADIKAPNYTSHDHGGWIAELITLYWRCLFLQRAAIQELSQGAKIGARLNPAPCARMTERLALALT